MEQRRNMNISTSVAADTFGDVTEGNVGEFLKFLPGVEVEYVDGISRGPRVGGLDQQYVGVTMDGASVASADAFVAYGATLNGAAGSQSRSVGFEQMSINSIESIEVSRTLSADMEANSPAGSINMRTRRAFDRKGRRVDWSFSAGFNTPDAANFGQTRGWDDHYHRQWRPNYQLDYSDVFLNQRLGVRLSVSSSSIRSEQQYVTHTYNKTQVTTGATPDLRPMVLTGLVFTDGPRLSSRANITATTDFKATSRLVLSLTAMFNAFENNAHTKSLTFNAAANGVAAATGRQNVLGNGLTDIRTNGLAANTSRTFGHGGGSAIKLTNSFTLTPKFEYKYGALTLDGTANFSRSKNDYETSSRGTIRVETLNTLPVDFRATRPDANSAEWTIVQTGGADWSNLANFTNPRITEEGRFAFTEIYTVESNAKYILPWRLPSFVKFGAKWAEENRKTDNTTAYETYSYIGPGGNILNANGTITAAGSFAAYPSPRPFNTNMGDIRALTIANLPVLTNRSALSLLYREHPEYFTNIATAENFYTAFVANKRDFRQHVTAGYGMANTRLGKLQVQGGLRWELTESEAREFDPLTAAQVLAAGFPISTTTRRATTIPGMRYQYFSQPRTNRSGDYANFFPSASLKYTIRPNLHAQAGYSHAISRPPVDALAGVWSINDQALLITAPNPNLKPERPTTTSPASPTTSSPSAASPSCSSRPRSPTSASPSAVAPKTSVSKTIPNTPPTSSNPSKTTTPSTATAAWSSAITKTSPSSPASCARPTSTSATPATTPTNTSPASRRTKSPAPSAGATAASASAPAPSGRTTRPSPPRSAATSATISRSISAAASASTKTSASSSRAAISSTTPPSSTKATPPATSPPPCIATATSA
jgi:iron complex outermembrane receptor protein